MQGQSADAALQPAYSLFQCGYTRKERHSGRLKLRCRPQHQQQQQEQQSQRRTGRAAAEWSAGFSLDALGATSTDLHSRGGGLASSSGGGVGGSGSGSSQQIFSFGVSTTMASAPFHRTKVVLVVDRFILVNMLPYSLEVRQFGFSSELLNVRPGEQVPLWWRPGVLVGSPAVHSLQARVNQFGWQWSGRFCLSKGEVSLRMRNEHDNTAFFPLVQVIHVGPRVCVVFRGGEHAPLRLENHTLDTFKLQQLPSPQASYLPSNPFSSSAAPFPTLPVSTLLPYHTTDYAWDEPMLPHRLALQVLASTAVGDAQGLSLIHI